MDRYTDSSGFFVGNNKKNRRNSAVHFYSLIYTMDVLTSVRILILMAFLI